VGSYQLSVINYQLSVISEMTIFVDLAN